jgi:hypothetical protein
MGGVCSMHEGMRSAYKIFEGKHEETTSRTYTQNGIIINIYCSMQTRC